MCHREIYWEKTASSEFEAESEDGSEEGGEAPQQGWWGVRTADRRRGLVETEAEATDDEREEDAIPAHD